MFCGALYRLHDEAFSYKLYTGKNPGSENPALVIPRGDLVSWNFNGLWSNGVMEYWSDGVRLSNLRLGNSTNY